MPSGSEEPQRDPALKRKAAGGLSRLCLVLGGGCFRPELLGLNMAVTVRTETVKQMCQLRDRGHKVRKAPATAVPASKLTPQQQAFIDVFAEDEPKNNNLLNCVMMQIV